VTAVLGLLGFYLILFVIFIMWCVREEEGGMEGEGEGGWKRGEGGWKQGEGEGGWKRGCQRGARGNRSKRESERI
jgi:hypothetical protein